MASDRRLPSSQDAAQPALRAAEARFIANNPLSKAQHDLAADTLPGGNTRTLLHTSPFPLCMKQGKDAYVWDLDGHKYFHHLPSKFPSPY
jgi:glutamate-1-semialdehyde 2,1-aminomutase